MAHRARFAAVMTAITSRLPFGLSEVVAPSLVGYLAINLCTFFLDLALLGLFHGTVGWPIPVAVTISYGSASVVSYVLNRVLNFRSHEDVGKQFPLYVAVSASNYLVFVLGLTDLLSHVGVYYEFSRVLAACCEAVYLYCMMRFVVFRDAGTSGPANADAPDATDVPATAAAQAPPSNPPAPGAPADPASAPASTSAPPSSPPAPGASADPASAPPSASAPEPAEPEPAAASAGVPRPAAAASSAGPRPPAPLTPPRPEHP